MNEIRDYNCYFTFSEISDEQHGYISRVLSDNNFEVDISKKSLEFESTGRDDDRLVLKIFREVAAVLKDADGELRCEIDNGNSDPHFEFFTIKGGKLLIQKGHLVRESNVDVV